MCCVIKGGCVHRVVETSGFTFIKETKADPKDVNSKYRFSILALHDRTGQAIRIFSLNPNFQQNGKKVFRNVANALAVTVQVLDHRSRKEAVCEIETNSFEDIKTVIYDVSKGVYKNLAA